MDEWQTNLFSCFNNIFRSKDKYVDYEAQTDQAGGVFLRWLWPEAKAELYSEFHLNDSRQNIRDLLLDPKHSSAITLGLRKILKKNNTFLFDWEWTKLERGQGRVLRNGIRGILTKMLDMDTQIMEK